MGLAAANRQRMAACNVHLGTAKEQSKQFQMSQMKTSNQQTFKWIQPKVQL
jgi:hypothetical protein